MASCKIYKNLEELKSLHKNIYEELKDVDFSSDNGFKSSEFAVFWSWIHTWAAWIDYLRSNSEIQKADDLTIKYEKFLKSMTVILTCLSCRVRFTSYLSQKKLSIGNNTDVFKTSVDIHNAVNSKLHKYVIDDKYQEELRISYRDLLPSFQSDKNIPQVMQQSFWFIIFMLVLNIPNSLDLSLSPHKLIHQTLCELFYIITDLMPSSPFGDSWKMHFLANKHLLKEACMDRKNAYFLMWCFQKSMSCNFMCSNKKLNTENNDDDDDSDGDDDQSCKKICLTLEKKLRAGTISTSSATSASISGEKEEKELSLDTKRKKFLLDSLILMHVK